jgi:hypothetical protein
MKEKFQKKTNKNRHWPSELTRNGRDWSIESDQLKIERMVMIPRKIESGMDIMDDRRMTKNGPKYERRMDGRDWFLYLCTRVATRSIMNERRNTEIGTYQEWKKDGRDE